MDRRRLRLAVVRAALPLVLSVLLPSAALGQRLHVRNYTAADGLLGSPVWDITQDSRGFLWIATDMGLNRFDGVSFSHLTTADGLPSPSVYTVRPRHNDLFLGADRAVLYDGKRLRDPRPGLVLSGTKWALDALGNVWFANQGNLCVFDGHAVYRFTERDGVPYLNAYTINAFPGVLWIGTRDAGALEIRVDGTRVLSTRRWGTTEGMPHLKVHAIVRDGSGRVYFGTRGGGLARLDAREMVTFGSKQGIAGNDIYALLIDRFGELVIGTLDNGITICDLPNLERCRPVTLENGLYTRSVFSLYEDREGTLWAGLANAVCKIIRDGVESYSEREGLPSSTIYSVLAEPNGDVWAGTLEGLGFKNHRDRYWRAFRTEQGLASNEVQALLRDHSGVLWAGTARGLCRLAGKRFDCIPTGNHDEDYVLDLLEAPDGKIWMATAAGLLVLTRGRDRQGHDRIERVEGSPPDMFAVARGTDGRIWFGGAHGLYVLDGTKVSRFDGLGALHSQVSDILASAAGDIWVTTTGQQLAYIRGARQLELLGPERGIDAETLTNITADGRGHLWLGSSKGVYEIDPIKVRKGARNVVERRLDDQDGLIGREIVGGNAGSMAPDGSLWSGSSQGLSRFEPARQNGVSVAPPVSIVRVQVRRFGVLNAPFTALSSSDRWLDAAPPRFPHQQNDLRFEFRGLSFRDERVRFRYQLEGFDTGWSAPTAESYKEYTNLPPGNYIFRVHTLSANGVPSWEAARFPFAIRPPWWMEKTSLALAAVLLLVTLATVHELRVRAIEKRTRELERLVLTRTSDLEARTHDLEGANEQIRQADRMKSRFLANVSHELRTPLNAIIGFSDILLGGIQRMSTERQVRFIENVNVSGRHLLSLINNLLDLSKIEAGKMDVAIEEVRLGEVVTNVDRVIQGFAAQRSVRIVLNVPPELKPAYLDSSKVTQILYNLLSNAIKFSPKGGTVEATLTQLSPTLSSIDADAIEIAVSDHGVGISPNDIERIFGEFEQTVGARGSVGTGLGLAIVKRFAEMQGGRVEVASRMGEGTTFRVCLPLDATQFATAGSA